MGNIMATTEVGRLEQSNSCSVLYLLQKLDIDSIPIILKYVKENNILYEYIYYDKDRG